MGEDMEKRGKGKMITENRNPCQVLTSSSAPMPQLQRSCLRNLPPAREDHTIPTRAEIHLKLPEIVIQWMKSGEYRIVRVSNSGSRQYNSDAYHGYENPKRNPADVIQYR
jgi:hypothetical protein